MTNLIGSIGGGLTTFPRYNFVYMNTATPTPNPLVYDTVLYGSSPYMSYNNTTGIWTALATGGFDVKVSWTAILAGTLNNYINVYINGLQVDSGGFAQGYGGDSYLSNWIIKYSNTFLMIEGDTFNFGSFISANLALGIGAGNWASIYYRGR